MRLKKMVIFILVFAAVYGFTAVDEAYSDMMDQPGNVALHVRRVNSEYVTFSIFGQTAAINIKELSEDWGEFSNEVTARLDRGAEEIRNLLGIQEPERDYSVFHMEML